MEITSKTKRFALIGGIAITVLGAYLSTGATAFFTANEMDGTGRGVDRRVAHGGRRLRRLSCEVPCIVQRSNVT